MFLSSTESKGLKLELVGLDEVPLYVVSDENKLRQVMINLLGNAIKFTDNGGIVLRVSVSRGPASGNQGLRHNQEDGLQTEDNDQLQFCVALKDAGVGIGEDELGKIFHAFEQTASGRERKNGTGLGLAISYNYVRMMDGGIAVTSTAGKGSVFRFTIPIQDGSSADIPALTLTVQVISLAPGQEIPRILVAEDIEDNRLLLMELLKSVGFDVREAVNGRQAVELFNQWQPHFI